MKKLALLVIIAAISCSPENQKPTPVLANDTVVKEATRQEVEKVISSTTEDTTNWIVYLNVVNFSDSDISEAVVDEIDSFNEQINENKKRFELRLIDGIIVEAGKVLSFIEMKKDWLSEKQIKNKEVYRDHAIEDALNVYVWNAGSLYEMTAGEGGSMDLGMTPIMSAKGLYQQWKPDFDHIFVSDEGLNNSSTLIHETGHYFGLGHTFDNDKQQLGNLGVTNYTDLCRNYMNYSCHTDRFSEEQMDIMMHDLYVYRPYLLEFQQ